jgi:hypothetical protein
MTMENAVFWNVALCRSCVNRNSTGLHGVTSKMIYHCSLYAQIVRLLAFCEILYYDMTFGNVLEDCAVSILRVKWTPVNGVHSRVLDFITVFLLRLGSIKVAGLYPFIFTTVSTLGLLSDPEDGGRSFAEISVNISRLCLVVSQMEIFFWFLFYAYVREIIWSMLFSVSYFVLFIPVS